MRQDVERGIVGDEVGDPAEARVVVECDGCYDDLAVGVGVDLGGADEAGVGPGVVVVVVKLFEGDDLGRGVVAEADVGGVGLKGVGHVEGGHGDVAEEAPCGHVWVVGNDDGALVGLVGCVAIEAELGALLVRGDAEGDGHACFCCGVVCSGGLIKAKTQKKHGKSF